MWRHRLSLLYWSIRMTDVTFLIRKFYLLFYIRFQLFELYLFLCFYLYTTIVNFIYVFTSTTQRSRPPLLIVYAKSSREGCDTDRTKKLFFFAHDVRPSHNRDKSVRLLHRRPEPPRRTLLVHVGMWTRLRAPTIANFELWWLARALVSLHLSPFHDERALNLEPGFDPPSVKTSATFPVLATWSRRLSRLAHSLTTTIRTRVRPDANTARP